MSKPVTEPDWTPQPGREWRVRPTGHGAPSSWPRPAHYTGDDFDADLTAATWREEGVECVVERAYRYGYRVPTPPPLTVRMLAAEGLAEQRPGNVWRIQPEGLRRLLEHARG